MTEYFYPDDVIVETVNGKRTARIGYNSVVGTNGSFVFSSEKEVNLTQDEICEITNLYHKIWLKARERARQEVTTKFLEENYPAIDAERNSWNDYWEKYKNDPKCGVGHWRSLISNKTI
jgi:hypothetical protein